MDGGQGHAVGASGPAQVRRRRLPRPARHVGARARLPGAQEWRDAKEYHNYGPTPQPELAYGGCEHFMDRIRIRGGVGDVLVMAMRHRLPQHFALISRVDPVYLVHAYTSSVA
jgi:hypothetical protein